MIALCLVCIALGLAGLIFGLVRGISAYKDNAHLSEENERLEALNASLQETRKNYEAQNARLEQATQENYNKYQASCERLNLSYEELQRLLQQQEKICVELDIKETQLSTLTQNIETLASSSKAVARASFEQYCDALDFEYYRAEEEYDNLLRLLQSAYDTQHDTLKKAFAKEEKICKADLDIIHKELDKIRATRAAAMEAQLREEEIKNQATFYTLQLSDADKRDVAYLQSIEYNLREARPLRMLIWTTFYRDKVNDLTARVGAAGASGIYKITHIDSGISYIGQATNIKDRWVTHVKCSLGIDTPVTSSLYQFTREKGIDNFTFEILEKCPAAELNEKEKFYIDLYQTYDFGLNKTRGNK